MGGAGLTLAGTCIFLFLSYPPVFSAQLSQPRFKLCASVISKAVMLFPKDQA